MSLRFLLSILAISLALSYRLQADVAIQKIQPWVHAQAESGRPLEFFVVLKTRADLAPASKILRKSDKGRFVYASLYDTARRSQSSLQSWLKANRIPFRSFYIVNALLVTGDRQLMEVLAARPDVERIEGNPRVRNKLPKPFLSDETLPAAAATVESNIAMVGAPDVWASGFTGQGIVIGSADTGMRWTHNSLKNQYRGWNGVAADHNYNWHDAIHDSKANPCGNDSPEPCDDHGHGTHTTGIAIGDDGGSNQIGMAPGARWIGCRNMDEGLGSPASYLECFEFWLAPYPIGGTPLQGDPTRAPDITSNSWGCLPSEGCSDLTFQDAVDAQQAAGIMTIVAAGNTGPDCNSVDDPPTLYDSAYVVGATDSTDEMANFSSRGPADSTGLNKPDIVAPGVSIRSANRGADHFHSLSSGTSMAAPHVAGAVALLWSAVPFLKNQPDATETALNSGALPLMSIVEACGGDYANGPNNTWGSGRLDIHQAIINICAPPGAPANLNSSVPGSQIDLTWDGVSGAVDYEIFRSEGSCPGSNFTLADTTSGTSFSDAELLPGATYSHLVRGIDSDGCPSAFSNCSEATLPNPCLFCDDFNNGHLDSNWDFLKPNWSESGGNLIGIPSKRKAKITAMPIFGGCNVCAVRAQMQSAGGAGNKIWLIGWFIDKLNKVELLMKEESNTWVFKQRVNGALARKMKAAKDIQPDVVYDVQISFDGTSFTVEVDGETLMTIDAAGAPNGTVGFEVKDTTGRFGRIFVN